MQNIVVASATIKNNKLKLGKKELEKKKVMTSWLEEKVWFLQKKKKKVQNQKRQQNKNLNASLK